MSESTGHYAVLLMDLKHYYAVMKQIVLDESTVVSVQPTGEKPF
jgi:hypothetical protein